MEKVYYTVGDIAEILGENTSLVRFWSDSFPKFLKPRRSGNGKRLFVADDVETFKKIHFLVRKCGLTLEGAAKKLQSDRSNVDKAAKLYESLAGIRAMLVEIRQDM